MRPANQTTPRRRKPLLTDFFGFGVYRSEPQALLHDVHADEECRGDVLLGAPLLAQSEEGAELIERMQRRTLDVLGQRVVLA